jgi:cytochrome P450
MGNLAYLYEPAHFDLYSLWHWMLKMLADHPHVQETFRTMADAATRRAYAEAIVHETLRMEQSELLYWRVSADIAFEGFLIPRGTTLRICIWEGHKDAATFPEPFRFRPERFIENTYGLDAFAPFGLGQRRCLGAGLVIDLSTMLALRLLEAYRVERVADDDPVKGPYHWQPGPRIEVRLAPAAPGAATPLT